VLGILFVALGLAQLISGTILGLWFALIGWFVIGAAAAERQLSTDISQAMSRALHHSIAVSIRATMATMDNDVIH
jgi:hypothetical protein